MVLYIPVGYLFIFIILKIKSLGKKPFDPIREADAALLKGELDKTTIDTATKEGILRVAKEEGIPALHKTTRFDSVYRFAPFTYVFAGFILLVPVLGFVMSYVYSSHNYTGLVSLTIVCALSSLYLFYLGRAPTQRLFFENDHVYLGRTEAEALPETHYGHMYYLTRPVKEPFSLLQYTKMPTLIVFRKVLTFPFFFYYFIDRFFPASNTNRQVLFMNTWNLEEGWGEKGIEFPEHRNYFKSGQLGLLNTLLIRAKKNQIELHEGWSDGIPVTLGGLFFAAVFLLIFLLEHGYIKR